MPTLPTDAVPRASWLPAAGSWRYHALLGAAGMLVLGPLGGIAAAYMNFSLGFFVGGQVLAGILGSAVTAGYGAPGRHGANYIQTAAASVAGMGGMAVVLQAMTWLGLAQPPLWQLVLYMLCIGMYGVGIGMLYTPLLVDRMQLTFPSGLAVANILRALTDPVLLRRSVARLGGGAALGLASGLGAARVPWLAALDLSAATFGAGMIVGARIGIAALVGGLAGWALTPWFVSVGWLAPGEPYRKATFLVALGMIMGAAALDVALLLAQAWRQWRSRAAREAQARRGPGMAWVAAWALLWGTATVAAGVAWFGQPPAFQLMAVLLVLVFALVNGISVGMVDQNPISSAFVLSSTGWRLGSDRMVQFGYQVAGIVVGALVAVAMARLFMQAYPVLALDQTRLPADQQPARWASAMTYKIVGVLHGLAQPRAAQHAAVALGLALGLATAVLRKVILGGPAWRRFAQSGSRGRVADFLLDAVLLPSPYASSFGGFVNLAAAGWMAAGGVAASVGGAMAGRKAGPGRERQVLPADMSTASLLGGGLIAGDALAALALGLAGLLAVTRS
ncbi:OPT oligopeptide transporter protein [compost metagenome]